MTTLSPKLDFPFLDCTLIGTYIGQDLDSVLSINAPAVHREQEVGSERLLWLFSFLEQLFQFIRGRFLRFGHPLLSFSGFVAGDDIF